MPKILVVEDSRLTRKITSNVLIQEGHEVVQAENGQAGLEIFSSMQDEIACIVTDLLMPVMTGQEMIRHLREIGSQVPLIVVSADVQSTTRQECVSLGVEHFLSKPISEPELVEAVKLVVKNKSERDCVETING